MAGERLVYLPLGGAGEVGMNMYLYGYGRKGSERFILVDMGVTFPDMDSTPGVDLIFPDIEWIADRADQLDAIFITHAHEDHVGAVGHLYERLKAPIYARKFTAHIARLKMEEHGYDGSEIETIGAMPEQVKAGPFTVGFQPISHSIPESSALIIDTPDGRVVHTGDFKIDETPILGEPFDRQAWGDLGPVKALVCDSTNVFSMHPGRSEVTVGPNIEKIVAEAQGMVVATTFASNIARVKTLADAGIAAGRSIVLLGRAMKRMIEAGVATGVITEFPSTVSPEEARDIPRANLMLLATGSQGERRAASAQLSRGKYQGLSLKEGDLFLFSSKTIPGNETSVGRIVNALSEMGVDVIDDKLADIHVSGHANRPDLQEMHALVKPQFLIPMHGEHRMLREHAKLGEAGGIASVVAPNGTMVSLSGNRPEVVEFVDTGRLYLDGSVQVGALDGVVRDRIRMALNGSVVVGVLIDEEDEPLSDAWVELRGLPETGRSKAPLADVLEEEVGQFLGRANRKTVMDDAKLEEQISRIVRQSSNDEIGKKPEVTVLISRLAV
ncbi:ribonuclease J [Litoreibacter roseus]|uniref:MBL fold hydrolase n=1 Tax=Litoreibacter roseus TaxID=2601869 RepID=A0A6N6JIP1_9RHOB|nr:ribonuclease J [Litoreibacter roseus]GFE65817.1 MBL fold hydrolase [Litoreibacter roseus]